MKSRNCVKVLGFSLPHPGQPAARRRPTTPTSAATRGLPRPTADALRRLADALGVSGDYLMEGATEEAAKARFEDRELLRQFQEVETLPDDDKAVVKKLLDAFLTKSRSKNSPPGRHESAAKVTNRLEGWR